MELWERKAAPADCALFEEPIGHEGLYTFVSSSSRPRDGTAMAMLSENVRSGRCEVVLDVMGM